MPRLFTLDRPGYFAIVDDSGNRLVEALITDGQFLATDGPASITPSSRPSGGIDALPNGNAPLTGSLKDSESVTSNKGSGPLVNQGLLARLQNTLNPDGQLNIKRVYDSADLFRIEVQSREVAETLQKKILQLIGDHESNDVELLEFCPGHVVDVIIKNNPRKKLLNIFGEA